MTKHKHYDMILAWAKGAIIQHRCYPHYAEWKDTNGNQPNWHQGYEYRIKPAPDMELTVNLSMNQKYDTVVAQHPVYMVPNVKVTFDGETKKLKKVELLAE